jgi:cyclic pyranopterin phosphate synthase
MPNVPFSWTPKEEILSFEDMFELLKIFIDYGIKKIRITGGEPLLRKDLDKFIKMINQYNSNIDLSLTTNAFLLGQSAKILKENGLNRVNISLDSLQKDVILKLTQKDALDSVLEGIDASLEAGLGVKLNSVPFKNINEDEIIKLLEYAKDKNIKLRYIEYMKNATASSNLDGLNKQEILANIKRKYKVKEIGRKNSSPEYCYSLEDGYEFGIIDPHQHDFCSSCNRLRITANGDVMPCLYFEDSKNIKDALLDKDFNKVRKIITEVIENKPEKNKWSQNEVSNRAFYQTGG